MTEMDIYALTQLTGASSGSAAASASVPVDTRALLTDIAASSTLSNSDKTGLITALARIDSGLSGAVRAQALQQVNNLGIYLRSTGSQGFPRWPMMTALRSYGLNLTEGGQGTNTAVVVKALQSHLEQIATGRGVPLEKAIAAASMQYSAPAPAPVQVKTPPPAEPKTVDTTA